MLIGPDAVCSSCHPAGSSQHNTAVQMAGWINGLDAALRQSEALLKRAEEFGMDVSEAQMRLIDGRESLVKSRLVIHSMQVEQIRNSVAAGSAIADETLKAGQAALHEKDIRPLGLAISVVLIVITMIAIRMLIRRLENASPRNTDRASWAAK